MMATAKARKETVKRTPIELIVFFMTLFIHRNDGRWPGFQVSGFRYYLDT